MYVGRPTTSRLADDQYPASRQRKLPAQRPRKNRPMSQLLESHTESFIDRRSPEAGISRASHERRQFTNSHEELSPEAANLASAIDQYKLTHRRRFVTFEEMLSVIKSLGYRLQ